MMGKAKREAAQRLLRDARSDHGATSADRERVRRALAQRLAAADSCEPLEASTAELATPSRLAGQSASIKLGATIALLTVSTLAVLRATDAPAPAAVSGVPSADGELAIASARDVTVAAPARAHEPTPVTAQPLAQAAAESSPDSAAQVAPVELPRARTKAWLGRAKDEARKARSSVEANDTPTPSAPAPDLASPGELSASAGARGDGLHGERLSGERSGARVAMGRPSGGALDADAAARTAALAGSRAAAPREPSSPPAGTPLTAAERAPRTAARAQPLAVANAVAADARAELLFVQRIQATLLDAKLQRVLALCSEHEQRWPHGSFAQERDGLRAIASCQAHTPPAQQLARHFADAYPQSPMLLRVRDACAPANKTPNQAPNKPPAR